MHGEHGSPHSVLGPAPARRRGHRPRVQAARQDRRGPPRRRHRPPPGARARRHLGRRRPGATEVPDYRLEVTYADGPTLTVDDPYRFLPTLGEMDLHLINEGRHEQLWEVLGARVHHYETPLGDTISGTAFAVWAPSARGVRLKSDFNGWDGREHPMRQLGQSGVWELFVPGVGSGTGYKFVVLGADGQWREKADPMASWAEPPADTASKVFESTYEWHDQDGWTARPGKQHVSEPMSVYEMHLASWRRGKTWHDLAEELPAYLADLGFTHVELMPVMQHPFGGSWGYHVTSYFAPDSRFGDPDGFRLLVDRLHQAGIGVILDWVPGHFATDEWALPMFDGTPLYEDPNPQRGWHKEWGSHIFNFGRHEVRNFLYANALYWLEEFHADGLRVDGVASMLYLDYSREEGEWTPNKYGGRENLEAVQFLQEMNATVYKRVPGATTIAEESTSWPQVTGPTSSGGLGFGFKWNMGWMHDSLGVRTARPGPPRLPPPRADVPARLRLVGELRAPDQPRRGRARQGLAAAQDARRPVAPAGQPARLPRLHVGAPRQAAAVHGCRDRPGVGVGRGPRARLVAARPPGAPGRALGWSATSTPPTGTRPRSGSATPSRTASSGSTPTTPDATSSPSSAAAGPARPSWSASPTSPRSRTRATGSACRRPASGTRSSTPTPRATPARGSATSAASRGCRRRPPRPAGVRRHRGAAPRDRLVPQAPRWLSRERSERVETTKAGAGTQLLT